MMSLHGLPQAVAAASSLPRCQEGGYFWLPPPASSVKFVDSLFFLLLSVSTFFFLLVVVLMMLFVVIYRRRPRSQPQASPSHNTLLEILWTAIPAVIVAIVFYRGFTDYLELRTPPAGAKEVRVTAKKWSWLFEYPGGLMDENLHVPVDEPVLLTMTSSDVIHSLFIPVMRVKMDVVPGRYSRAWFCATETGDYPLYCSEYCGTQHFSMLARVIVQSAADYKKWLAAAGDMSGKMSPAEYGELLYRRQGCANCHSLDGSAGTGPSFKGIYGKPVELEDGRSVVVEDNYIREMILEPGVKVVKGYQPVMPTFKGLLSDKDITAIIEFIKSRK